MARTVLRLVSVSANPGRRSAGARREQLQRLGVRHGPDRQHALARDTERFLTGREDDELRATRQQVRYERGNWRDEMLAVVEHQQNAARHERFGE